MRLLNVLIRCLSAITTVAVAAGQYSGGGHIWLWRHADTHYQVQRQVSRVWRTLTIRASTALASIGLFFELDTRLSSSKYPADSIVVYPNGIGVRASTPRACPSAGASSIPSPANATVGGEFAAFAPASGSFYTDNDANHESCKPARVPTPIIEIHGGADTSVAYNGGVGEGGINPAIPAWLDRWAERNQCDKPNSQSDLYGGDVHHLSWTCKGVAGALQHYKTDDQKHCWASTEINFSQLAAGDKPTHIEASAIFREFFKSFTRPA
ncbi:unnamed protein product [Clonostachys rosea f. rosea IK726]|uniref:Uncharacterized protein n=1 Tax=Clonostachys rosea f. rosea IK726 TaxID=1349383 RepID=A0ACA9UUQ9_BIOOC|nr:unnamed protein product [Clonostachys rosea f. rosea IK726]